MDPLTLISLIAAAAKAGQSIFDFALKVKEHLKQAGEMTPQEEAVWDEKMKEVMQQPHWKPSDQP